jgi:hypothetical protein
MMSLKDVTLIHSFKATYHPESEPRGNKDAAPGWLWMYNLPPVLIDTRFIVNLTAMRIYAVFSDVLDVTLEDFSLRRTSKLHI